jgi:putative ABC transport system permease protein
MLTNYLKIAFRNLWKFRVYSGITIFGLALGLTCALLILLFVRFEWGFDKFHTHYKNTYRIITHREINNKNIVSVNTPLLLANELVRSIPEVEAAVRFGRAWPGAFKFGDRQFQEPDFFVTDAAITDILDIRVVHGDLRTMLSDRNLIAISTHVAKKYFGDHDPIGKTIAYTFEESHDFTVGAVFEPLPANSHVHLDFLSNVEAVTSMADWSFDFLPTYVLLKKGATPETVDVKLKTLVDQYYPKDKKVELQLQPLSSIHLYSHYEGEFEANGNIQTVLILSGIGVFLLLLAAINFINMVTARAMARAREVGVRKVFGAARAQLVRQFMIENIGITMLAMILALLLTELALPFYNSFSGHQLHLAGGNAAEVVGLLLLLALLLGFISAAYPAWFMSGFRPAKILRGRFSLSDNPDRFFSLRKNLITIQCSVSLLLIICVVMMDRQMNFLLTKGLGINPQGVAYIRSPQDPINYPEFKNTLGEIPGISVVTYSGRIPGSGQDIPHAMIYAEGMNPDARLEIPTLWVSHDFLRVFAVELVQGRDFSIEFPNDNRESVLVNETAATLLWNSQETGKGIDFYRRGETEPALQTHVVGIVRDFHFQSLHQPIQPLIIRLGGYPTYLAFRYDRSTEKSVMAHVEHAWKKLSPEWPLELGYLPDSIQKLYGSEGRLTAVTKFMTFVALVLACFGLFGLAFFSAERKTREIGIRKVLGASTAQILRLMLSDFSVLLAIAFIIASPLAFILSERWLSTFAYRVSINGWVFVVCGAAMVIVTLITVGFQSVKAASANPVDSLRNE